MSAISNSGSSSAAAAARARQAAEAAAKKRAAEAAKKAAEAAAKKKAAEAAKKAAAQAAKNKDAFSSSKTKDVEKLANGKGKLALNKDGSSTQTFEKTKKSGATTKQELTTKKDLLGSKLKFEETHTVGNKETKTKLSQNKDLLTGTTASQSVETTVKRGNVTKTHLEQTDTGAFGSQRKTIGDSKGVTTGNTTVTNGTSTTTSGFNSKSVTNEKKTEVKGDWRGKESTTTTTSKSTTGTDFQLSTAREFKDGTFSLKTSGDWKKHSFNKEVGKEKEITLKPSTADKGFTQTDKSSKLDKAQKVGDLAAAMGAKTTVWKGEDINTVGDKPFEKDGKPVDNHQFVGTRSGVRGSGELTVGANGVEGKFNREAVAGAYAERGGAVEGDHGKASYQAQAKVEARASFDASGKLNANGLDLKVGAKVGVSAEASVKGKLETKPVKFAGVDLTAGVEGNARVAAELSAEATGTAKITRNPPTAILEGKAGASAVVKAEADVKVSAGPFSVKASGYASAGAEATASGVIGYQDGKLKLGGSLGAALGVGLGGSVAVEVDVKQIGEMAKNTAVKVADQNGDGKLDMKDAAAIGSNLASGARNTAAAVSKTVSNAARATVATTRAAVKTVTTTVSNAARNVASTVSNAASNAASAVSNTARNVASTVSNAASNVASSVSNAASAAKSTVSNAASKVASFFGW